MDSHPTDGEEVEETARGNWSGKLDFLFTSIGFAVGLGNVWRFPYMCYKNGGGAFLVPYVVMLCVAGLPLFFMESAIGQYASLGPTAIWKFNPLFKGVGYAMVMVTVIISIYYNVVISHILFYLFASIRAIFQGIPWTECGNEWNTEHCVEPHYSKNGSSGNFTGNESLPLKLNGSVGQSQLKTPSEEYYENYVLQLSTGVNDLGMINWRLAACLLLAWIIVLVCLIRGVQSLGKVVYFTALFPYLMLTILLMRGLTLPGAIDGIRFYFTPDFSRLTDARVWCDAATQIFYSLCACCGGLIAMSSFNSFNNNCYRDAILVSMINCATSVYAGTVVFSVLGFMAYEKGVSVADVAQGGPGLVFVIYPEALSRMPVPWLWSVLFFFMMATLGFSSQFSLVETVLSSITDEYPHVLREKFNSIKFRIITIAAFFLVALPLVCKGGLYLVNLVDFSVSGFPLLCVGLAELIALQWIYGYDRFAKNIKTMLGITLNIYWKATWQFISPAVISGIIIFNLVFYKAPTMNTYVYPPWAHALCWLIALLPILVMPCYFIYAFWKTGEKISLSGIREAMKPTDEWENIPKCSLKRNSCISPDPGSPALEETSFIGQH